MRTAIRMSSSVMRIEAIVTDHGAAARSSGQSITASIAHQDVRSHITSQYVIRGDATQDDASR